MQKTLGIYVHVPFCDGGKCPYCDFYSVPLSGGQADAYCRAFTDTAKRFAARAQNTLVDTIYFGGGTPSLLGERLIGMLGMLRESFRVAEDAEITFEANPSTAGAEVLPALRQAGFNRLSVGLQSAQPEELKALGRRHSPQGAARYVRAAQKAGFENVSLDLMLATPGQTLESLRESVRFAASLDVPHISAYLLKLEPGTRFFEKKDLLQLPEDDDQAEFYLEACEQIERYGLGQYEISNFAKPGYESRHNLKYWNCDPYLGIGPGAYSYFAGGRFHFDRDLSGFISGADVVEDGPGGSLEEYIMLRLRLREGLRLKDLRTRYGVDFGIFFGGAINSLLRAGCISIDETALRLTRSGFLLSNTVIADLLYQLEATGA